MDNRIDIPWITCIRKFIVQSDEKYLDDAIICASDDQVAQLLETCKKIYTLQEGSGSEKILVRNEVEEKAGILALGEAIICATKRTLTISSSREQVFFWCEQAIDCCKQLGFNDCMSQFLSHKAEMLFTLGEYQEARVVMTESIALLRQDRSSESIINLARALNFLGAILLELKSYDLALDVSTEAAELVLFLYTKNQERHRILLLFALTNFGKILGTNKRSEDSLKVLFAALNMYVILDKNEMHFYRQSLISDLLLPLGWVLYHCKRLIEAERIINLANYLHQDLPDNEKNKSQIAQIHNCAGAIHNALGEFQTAEFFYQSSMIAVFEMDDGEKSKNMHHFINTVHNYADLLIRLDRFSEAEEWIRRCFDADRYYPTLKILPDPKRAGFHDLLGRALLCQTKYVEAKDNFEQAHTIYQRLYTNEPSYLKEISLTELSLSSVHDWLGNASEAEEYVKNGEAKLRQIVEFDRSHEIDLAIALIRKAELSMNSLILEIIEHMNQLIKNKNVSPEELLIFQSPRSQELKDILNEAKSHIASRIAPDLCARIYYLLGMVGLFESHLSDPEVFDECIRLCEMGILTRHESQNRYRFKREFVYAYLRLIGKVAKQIVEAGSTDYMKLVGLLESLRQVELLSGVGSGNLENEIKGFEWQSVFQELMESEGWLSKLLRDKKSVFVWVQEFDSEVLFVILKPGKCEVCFAPNGVDALDKYCEAILHYLYDDIEVDFDLLAQVFPDEFTQLLIEDMYNTIFISPGAKTIQFPWDLIRIPNEDEKKAVTYDFLGLKKLVVKVQGLVQLATVVQRKPKRTDKVLIVGNPLHTGASPLPEADGCANEQSSLFQARGFSVIPSSIPLVGHQATFNNVMSELNKDFMLWLQMGHGGNSGDEKTFFLALAGDDRLFPRHITNLKWDHHPIVHLDCCLVGRTVALGGGKFEDHTTASLQAGAACVLNCEHSVDDFYASEFTTSFYENLLGRNVKTDVRSALLETRRLVALKYGNDPSTWGMLNVWGNPWVSLT